MSLGAKTLYNKNQTCMQHRGVYENFMFKFTINNTEPNDINCAFCPSGLFMGSTSLS